MASGLARPFVLYGCGSVVCLSSSAFQMACRALGYPGCAYHYHPNTPVLVTPASCSPNSAALLRIFLWEHIVFISLLMDGLRRRRFENYHGALGCYGKETAACVASE